VLELKILEHSLISSKRDWRIQVDNPFKSFKTNQKNTKDMGFQSLRI
jgi:hypothetical protein